MSPDHFPSGNRIQDVPLFTQKNLSSLEPLYSSLFDKHLLPRYERASLVRTQYLEASKQKLPRPSFSPLWNYTAQQFCMFSLILLTCRRQEALNVDNLHKLEHAGTGLYVEAQCLHISLLAYRLCILKTLLFLWKTCMKPLLFSGCQSSPLVQQVMWLWKEGNWDLPPPLQVSILQQHLASLSLRAQ